MLALGILHNLYIVTLDNTQVITKNQPSLKKKNWRYKWMDEQNSFRLSSNKKLKIFF